MTTRGLLTTRPLMLRMYSPRIPMKNSWMEPRKNRPTVREASPTG